jgi:hypothetical protein
MKSVIFWAVTPCIRVEVIRLFIVLIPSVIFSMPHISTKLYTPGLVFFRLAGYFLGLIFDPDDGGRNFLLNVGELQPNYTALHHRR